MAVAGASGPIPLAACLRALGSLLRDVGILATGGDRRLIGNTDLESQLVSLARTFDSQRSARRDTARFCGPHNQRAETPHLFFQKADCVVQLVAAEGVAADQFGEPIGLVNRRLADRPHFVERNGNAPRGRLPSCLRARQPAANDADHSH